MRSDIVPGALFPDYELTDHAAKRRKLSELQGPHPMVLVLSRGGFAPRIAGRPNYLFNCTVSWKLDIAV
jgi:peroxiredoxin